MKRWLLSINYLGLIAAILMIVAMYYPWWSFQIEFSDRTDIYPYLVDGPGSELIGYRRSPQMTLLTGVLVAGILMGLAGSLWKHRASRILIGLSGAVALLGLWRLLARLAGVAARFHLSLQGEGTGSLGGFAKVQVATWLRPGSYIIIIAGILALLAAIFYSRLTKNLEGDL